MRVRADSLELGAPLLMDGATWARRAWSMEVKRCWFFFTLSTLGLVAAFIVTYMVFSGDVGSFTYSYLIIYFLIAYPLVHSIGELGGLWIGLRAVGTGPGVPGLYFSGIQTSIGPLKGASFIPYKEMDRVRLRQILWLDTVVIYLKGRRGGSGVVTREFLGEDGLATLVAMAGKEPQPIAPPRLVLYAPADPGIAIHASGDNGGLSGPGVVAPSTFPQGRY